MSAHQGQLHQELQAWFRAPPGSRYVHRLSLVTKPRMGRSTSSGRLFNLARILDVLHMLRVCTSEIGAAG